MWLRPYVGAVHPDWKRSGASFTLSGSSLMNWNSSSSVGSVSECPPESAFVLYELVLGLGLGGGLAVDPRCERQCECAWCEYTYTPEKLGREDP